MDLLHFDMLACVRVCEVFSLNLEENNTNYVLDILESSWEADLGGQCQTRVIISRNVTQNLSLLSSGFG